MNTLLVALVFASLSLGQAQAAEEFDGACTIQLASFRVETYAHMGTSSTELIAEVSLPPSFKVVSVGAYFDFRESHSPEGEGQEKVVGRLEHGGNYILKFMKESNQSGRNVLLREDLKFSFYADLIDQEGVRKSYILGHEGENFTDLDYAPQYLDPNRVFMGPYSTAYYLKPVLGSPLFKVSEDCL